MPRLLLTDEYWSKLRPIMLEAGIYDKAGLRLTVEGILYRLRVGCPWRDLPQEFGAWNSVYKRFNDWSEKGKLIEIFSSLSSDPDTEWNFIDASISKAHQHSSGAKSGEATGVGKSVAGNTSKIHMVVDSFGLPIKFEITGGQVHDCKVAPEIVSKLDSFDYLVADKGYDSEALRDQIRKSGAIPVIPRKSNSKSGNDNLDRWLYRYRHLVENIFARLKHFRAIATRYDKLKRNFEGMVLLGCFYVWLPM